MSEHSAEIDASGCDCAALCDMGPTCPGAILAGLDGAGCHRVTSPGKGQA